MKIGFVSRIGEFPERKWKSEFRIADTYELDYLELIANYPYLGPSSYTQNQANQIKKLSEKYNLDLIIHLLPNQYGLAPEKVKEMFASSYGKKRFVEHENLLKNKFFNPASLDEKVRNFSIEEIKRTYELGKRVNAKIITIHGGSFRNFRDYKDNLNQTRKTLEELNPLFTDIKLCVENMPIFGHFGNAPRELPIDPEDLLYLVDGLKNIGICFDIGHANNVGNPLFIYDELKKSKKIWNIHVSDNNGKADDHLKLGEGNVDFKKFIKQLLEDNYKWCLSIELDTWCKPPKQMRKNERIKALEYIISIT